MLIPHGILISHGDVDWMNDYHPSVVSNPTENFVEFEAHFFTHEPRAGTVNLIVRAQTKRCMSKGRPKTPQNTYSVVTDPQA